MGSCNRSSKENSQMIKVRYFGRVQFVTNRGEDKLEVSEDMSLKELLDQLGAVYGTEFKKSVFRSEGEFRTFASIYVDERNVKDLDEKLGRFKEVRIIAYSPVSGG